MKRNDVNKVTRLVRENAMKFDLVRLAGKFISRLLFACATGPIVSNVALAHHSGVAYDMTHVIAMEGTVSALSWKNPHIILMLATKGADGAALVQEIEVMSVSQAVGLGLRRESISPGAHIVVRAGANRRGSGRAFGITVTTSDGVVMPLSSFSRISAMQAPVVDAEGIAGKWAPSIESFGKVVPAGSSARLTESGRAARQQALTEYSAPGGAGVAICEPLSPPLLHIFPDLRTIVVADRTVKIRSETNGVKQERVVHLDQIAHPASFDPTTEGHSIGRWEDKTLVIDTVGFAFSRTPDLLLLPTHRDTHLVERLTLTQDRRHLVYEFTIDIPAYLVEPVTLRATWDHRPDLEPSGAACDADVARRLVMEE